MKTIIIGSTVIYLSSYQLYEFTPRIKRLRRVAHAPSRAWGAAQVQLNWNKKLDFWSNLLKTNEEEYFRLLDLSNTEEIDRQRERRIQKSKGYSCHACA